MLVVDDGSPDGTGELADGSPPSDPRIRVRHRPPSRASAAPTSTASGSLSKAARGPSSRWTPTSVTIPRHCRRWSAPVAGDRADLVIGSRYTEGGGVVDWGLGRRVMSRGGSLFARTVLGLPSHDLTGGFKAWRASTLAAVPSMASMPVGMSSRSR